MSYDASEEEGAFDQTVRGLSYGGEGIWPNYHVTFLVAEKA